MYMLNMVIILIVMYCNVVTAIDKIPTYLLRFNMQLHHRHVMSVYSSWLFEPAWSLHVLCSSWTLGSTWADRLRPSLLARWERSFCFRYSVRVLGLWQYRWYVVTGAWEISQAYEVVQEEVWRSCTIELDWYKNSDLRSEVGIDIRLNSTTLCL